MKRAIKIALMALSVMAAATVLSMRTDVTAEAEQTKEQTKEASAVKDVVMLYEGSPVGFVNEAGLKLEPGDNEVTVIMENGELLAPVSFLTSAYGGSVLWNGEARTATLNVNGRSIVYTIGRNEILVGSKATALRIAPKIVRNKTFVDVRSFAQAIGAEYFTDGYKLGVVSGVKNIYNVNDKTALDELRAKFQSLPAVGTAEKFAELMEGFNTNWGKTMYLEDSRFLFKEGGFASSTNSDSAMTGGTGAVTVQTESARASTENDYSSTNVQVDGVDEADIIKTDGEYIYFVKENRVSVVKAEPESMKLESTIKFTGEDFYPMDMYADGDTLIIIGNASRRFKVDGMDNYQSTTRAYVYDMSDKKNPKVVREVESDGGYLSSRKIGNSFYMITNSWIYSIGEPGIYPLPLYRDTLAGQDFTEIGYDRMYYFPNFSTNNYLTVTGFEIDKPEESVKVNTYLGGGQNVYASTDNLYIAATEYETDGVKTTFYKFAVEKGNVRYEGKQSVSGTLLNQFSMDEHNGYFRAAVTDSGSREQKNALYVMDAQLNVTGKIEDIAPGERIYSVRFMGDKGYMVTFKNVDPLFAMDLQDPYNPKILGALKIPGYSNYLHPYDENHLIGFGKDTTEYDGMAYYKGMKLAVFDVTDMTNPKELFVEYIGDRGTESPLLYDHKALLFSKEKNILAFPVNVAELTAEQKSSQNSVWEYGQFTFQGAYVYSLDLEKGFTLQGSVSHMTEQDMLKAGYYGGDYNKQIQRIIYIGDNLYTASNSTIKANSINGLKELGAVSLE